MLLQLYIEPYSQETIDHNIDFIGSLNHSEFFKTYEGKDDQKHSRSFTVPNIKIKCMNESYFFFLENTWFLLKANDQIICDQYKIRVELIAENIPLPFEIDSSSEVGSITNDPLSDHAGLSNNQDPLAFLYNTPAQRMAAIQLESRTSSGKKEEDFVLTFWDLIKNNKDKSPIRHTERPLLPYNAPETGENFKEY